MSAREIEPYWLEENDWLAAIEFLPANDAESRGWAAETIGYLFGYAHLTNTRILALVGDRQEEAYELLFSFSSVGSKNQFLDLIRSNEYLGEHCILEDLKVPSRLEIRKAQPIPRVLPNDIVAHAMLIASTLACGSEQDLPLS